MLEAAQIPLSVQRKASQQMGEDYIAKQAKLGIVVTRPDTDTGSFQDRVQPVIEE